MKRLSDDERWEAVRSRARDTSFLFAVRTTGIVCRPGCSARLPVRTNVLYFDDLAAARTAGFRPCKRCAPDDLSASAERERLVERACGLLDAEEPEPFADVAVRVGLSRHHLARTFRSVTGVTPGEYLHARRLERFRDELERGRSVIDAATRAGYGSASRMYERRVLGMTPTAFRRHGAGETVRYLFADTSLGRLIVARASGGVCALELRSNAAGAGAESADDALLGALRARFPAARFEPEASVRFSAAVAAAVAASDAGAASALSVDVRGRLLRDRLRFALRNRSE